MHEKKNTESQLKIADLLNSINDSLIPKFFFSELCLTYGCSNEYPLPAWYIPSTEEVKGMRAYCVWYSDF
jgi:hypothetical protein